jgi:hypothetical protein
MRLRFPIFMLVLSGLLVCAAAQNPPAPTPPSQSSPAEGTTDDSRSTPAPALSGVMGIDAQMAEEGSSTDQPQIPALLGGQGASLAFSSEMERSNYLRGGLNVGATYDDNTFLTPSGAVGNIAYSVFPNISIEQSRSRLRWTLGYAAGVTVNQRFSNSNQGSHNLNFDSEFRLGPHVNLRIAETFSLATGFFDSGNGTAAGGGDGLPNANLITPFSKQRTSSTVVGANYHFALKDVVGVSGSFFDQHFSDVQGQFALVNSRTASGSGYWLHEFFRRDWTGVGYRFERLTFDPGAGETRVHSITVVNTLSLSDRFTFSGYFGPEYSDNQGMIPGTGGPPQPSHFTNWSFAGGVDGSWQNQRTSVAAGYSRRINDGGGLLGVARVQGVHADFRQQLFPGWAATLGASYGRNRSLTVPGAGSASSVDLTSVRASLERNLGKSLGLRFTYFHDFQQQFGVSNPPQNLDAHRNRFSLTLFYQWAKPLGI